VKVRAARIALVFAVDVFLFSHPGGVRRPIPPGTQTFLGFMVPLNFPTPSFQCFTFVVHRHH